MASSSTPRALVTGGCGFVGRALVRDLVRDGYEVWVLDNLFTGRHPDAWLAGFEASPDTEGTRYKNASGARVVFLQAEVVDRLRRETPGSATLPAFDEVYHLAAVVGGRAVLIEQDPMLVATNHVIDASFFQWAVRRREAIGRILYASSSVAYPKALQNAGREATLKEEHLVFADSGQIGLPESIYGWIKLAGEYLGVLAVQKYGLKVAAVRPFSGYGEDQELSYPIPSIALRAARREDPLTVWGSGNQSRDFIYIDDFVAALRLVIRHTSDGSGVNIGTGTATSFREVARILARLEGYAPEIKGLTDKAEGSFTLRSDVTKLKSFGWTPRHSLEDGLARCLRRVKEEHLGTVTSSGAGAAS